MRGGKLSQSVLQVVALLILKQGKDTRMSLGPQRRSQLEQEAREALEQLGSPVSVLLFDFSTGIASVPNDPFTQQAVVVTALNHGVDLAKLAGVFKRPLDRICYAFAGKAKQQGLTLDEYMEEFVIQYRAIGLPVFDS